MSKNLIFLGLLSLLLIGLTFKSSAQTSNTWTQKSNVGGAVRFGAVSFSIGNKGYIGTGNTTGNTKDFWEYDPLTDIWSQKADFGGTARMFATGLSIGNKGYIACGDDGKYKNDFWEYNPVTNSWNQKADFAGPPRTGAVSFSIGSKGYIGIGLLSVNPVLRTNDFWEYDPANDVWTQKSNIGTFVRAFGVGFSIGNKGYIGTGNNGSLLTKDFWEYNPTTDTWVQKADFGGTGRFMAVGIGTESFGYIGLGDIGGGYSNDLWEYNPALDTWAKRTNFGGQVRTLATGFSISNKVFVGTGTDWLNTINYNDFWEYTPLCTPPVISTEPVNQSLTYSQSAIFTVTALNAISYQWEADAGSGYAAINNGGKYSGVTNDTLTISLPTVEMTGYKYRCVVKGNCLLTTTSNGNAALTVTPLEVQVTPDANQSKNYGSADPTPYTYTYSPMLVGTDVLSGLLDREAGEATGNYAFTFGNLSAGSNYSLTLASGPAFSIAALPIIVTPDGGQAKEYGSSDPAQFTYTYSPLLIGSDAISGRMSRAAGEDVGHYEFTTGTLTVGDNYSLTVATTPTYDITAKKLIITAEDKHKCYDGNVYSGEYTVTYNGLLKSKDFTLLDGTLIFSGNAIEATGTGSHTITPSGLTSTNYNLSFVDGALVINPVSITPDITRNGDSIISSSLTGNQWYKDGIEIPGSTDEVYVATSNGTYYTVITEGGCSSAPSNSIVFLHVSIKEANVEFFDVYPNPSNGEFNIRFKNSGKEIYSIEIYNSLGSLVLKQNNTDTDGENLIPINLNGPKSGLYTVVMRNKSNTLVKKVFIVK